MATYLGNTLVYEMADLVTELLWVVNTKSYVLR